MLDSMLGWREEKEDLLVMISVALRYGKSLVRPVPGSMDRWIDAQTPALRKSKLGMRLWALSGGCC